MDPLVSICCEVYNHEPYLHDCIEGFLSQKTDFPFEVLIHDDASTDHSAEIIKEYVNKYPALIHPLYQTQNQFSQGISIWATYQFPRAKGKYIALCEGDDYWTDPLKLQKQVDILEKDKSIMAVVTNAMTVDRDGHTIHERMNKVVPGNKEGCYDLHSYFSIGHQYHTANVVFRCDHLEEIIQKTKHTHNRYLGDWSLWAILHSYGVFYYLDQVTSAYRINPTSLTHSWDRVGRAKAHQVICGSLKEVLPEEYGKYLEENGWMHFSLFKAYFQEKKFFHAAVTLIECLVKYPAYTWQRLKDLFRIKYVNRN